MQKYCKVMLFLWCSHLVTRSNNWHDFISRSLRAPIPNKRNVNVILQCWMQCACAVVARHVRALHLYYSWRCAYYSWQLCLFVGFHKQPVYTSSCISLLSTPLSFFAVYYLDRSRSPTMFNILLVEVHFKWV